MELRTFISKTLVDIAKGIEEANNQLGEHRSFSMEPFKRESERGYITFDVAVSIIEKSGKEGGAGIQVFAAQLGGKANSAVSQEVVSRLKFSIMPERMLD